MRMKMTYLRSRYRLLAILLCFPIGAILGIATLLWFDSDWHGYPAVTRCEVCGNRIWTWQDYERREFKVKVDKPNAGVVVGMSGMVHCRCEGTVEREVKITTTGISTPRLNAQEKMEVTVPVSSK